MNGSKIHNHNFKPIEFDGFKAEFRDNAFTLTPQREDDEKEIVTRVLY